LGDSDSIKPVKKTVFSLFDLKRRGRHGTLVVADLADDVSHICSLAGRDASLLDSKEFNHACSLFVRQAGDLGCFKCSSSVIWYQKHLSKCLQPTGAIMGLNRKK